MSDAFPLPPGVGRVLAGLRERDKMNQGEIATRLKVNQSTVSRWEKGEVALTLKEALSYLGVLKGDEAPDYANYLSQTWEHIERPAFDHPDWRTLAQGERCITMLGALDAKLAPDDARRLGLGLHSEAVSRALSHLAKVEHTAVLVGNKGVGKSTAVAALTGLVFPHPAKAPLRKRVVLPTGSGWTSLCETVITAPAARRSAGAAPEVRIFPEEEGRVRQLVQDLCADLFSQDAPKAGEQDPPPGVSIEARRALRNMANLPEPDGADQPDALAEWKKQFSTPQDMATAFVARLNLPSRRAERLAFPAAAGKTELEWLAQTCQEINFGTNKAVPFPSRVEVVWPASPLSDSDYDWRVGDQRGLDGSWQRPDLKQHLDDPHTLLVLCSTFKHAPDDAIKDYLRDIRRTKTAESVRDRLMLLILAQHDEAECVRGPQGREVGDAEEGYRIQAARVAQSLANVQAEPPPALFLNVDKDSTDDLRRALGAMVERLRAASREQVKRSHDWAVATLAAIQAPSPPRAHEKVRRELDLFVQSNSELGPPSGAQPTYAMALREVQAANGNMLAASVRRRGDYDKLHVYHLLGQGTADHTSCRSASAFGRLEGLVSHLLSDKDLAPAHDDLRQLLRNAQNWREELLQAAYRQGFERYLARLHGADEVWEQCLGYYGSPAKRGHRKYGEAVAGALGSWFQAAAQRDLLATLEQLIQEEWRQVVLREFAQLCRTDGGHDADAGPRPGQKKAKAKTGSRR